MNRNHRNSEILVIDQNPFDLAAAQHWLVDDFTTIQSVACLAAGLERILSENIGFIVCDLELVESGRPYLAESSCSADPAAVAPDDKILNQGIPIVFFSATQQADVVFQQINSLSVFCLKKCACLELLPTFIGLAIKTADQAHQLSEFQRPHINVPDVLGEPFVPANIHSMY